MIRLLNRLSIFTLVSCAFALPRAHAIPVKKTVNPAISRLVAHKAVYEITLASRRHGVAVTGVKGRMVFELTGSPCDGYTQNMRMVSRITDDQGKQTLSDIRSSTWEKGGGGRFRFSSSHFFDSNLQESVAGSATRLKKGQGISVKLKKPARAALDLPDNILFPTQHSLAILTSAEQGKKILAARIYDGSEQGQGFYQTYSFIGDKISPELHGSEKASEQHLHLEQLGLAKMPSWPVAISYFNIDDKLDAVPTYELSFLLYPNGVSRKLLINYGEFSVYGKLTKLTYLHKGACK